MSTVIGGGDPDAVVVVQRTSTVVRLGDGSSVVATYPKRTAVVAVRGIPGPPGPPGGGAGATYTHNQAIAAAVWTVPHNLGRYPSVTVTDHLGNVIAPDVRYVDNDIVQVTHGTALTGFAYCN